MKTFVRPIEALRLWLVERGISPDCLTVILNFSDANAAVQFDAGLRRDTEQWQFTPGATLDVRKFELMGIKVRVESPVHTP